MDEHTIFLIIGVITGFGAFATINSRFATAYDTEMSLLLLVLSIISFAIGLGYADNFLSDFIDLYKGIGQDE